ncbi:alpha/beta hydrolase [Kitasatospora sp. NBC_00315]|uniref:alpha/beta hydrolase n=1 Tax=Kitasatospora sp. NBC_00315 TaxID=2975963 RepID=UPI0032445E13
MDIRTLRDAQPAELHSAADAYDRLAEEFARHARAWEDGVRDRVRGSAWAGGAADRAEESLTGTGRRLTAARLELTRAGDVLREGAEAFLLAQSQLRQALAEAEARGCPIGEDGGPALPFVPEQDRHDPDARLVTAAVGDLRRRITGALADAAYADRVTADRLRALAGEADSGAGLDLALATAARERAATAALTGTAPDLLARGLPAPHAQPAEVAAWWHGLTGVEQQRLLDRHPALLGNRDGLPAAVRDRANRLMLPTLIERLEHRPRLTPADRNLLEGFRRIRARLLDEDAGGPPHVLLLALGSEGQGRAALSFGDPDTADDVVVYVPGLGTRVGDVGGKDGSRARCLWAEARAADPARSTASIAWLGYDAPQVGPDGLAVAGTERAARGGAGYQGFLRGLRASREGAPAHLTALGHSYGSLTVGQAAQRPGGIPADEIVLVGSPGTGARTAAQLRVGAGHVWVGAAEHDPVTRLPGRPELERAAVGAALGPVPGAVAALAGSGHDPDELWFGRDPASREFGARRFAVADGRWQQAHSDYWALDHEGRSSSSLSAMGRIVAGHGEQLEPQAPR